MTIKEAVTYELKMNVDNLAIDKALTDAGITAGDTYTSGKKQEVDMVVISILEGLLSAPDISEGSYSIKYNYKAIEARLATLKSTYFPETVSTPILRARNVW